MPPLLSEYHITLLLLFPPTLPAPNKITIKHPELSQIVCSLLGYEAVQYWTQVSRNMVPPLPGSE
jgi:hypothetical protein